MKSVHVGLTAIGLLGWCVPASAAVSITNDDQIRTVDCAGGPLVVAGFDNQITATGHCSSVVVRGKKNRVTFDSSAATTVSGTNNKVFWQHDAGTVHNACKGAECQVEAIK